MVLALRSRIHSHGHRFDSCLGSFFLNQILQCWAKMKKKKRLPPPGIELRSFSPAVLCDNHYTTGDIPNCKKINEFCSNSILFKDFLKT